MNERDSSQKQKESLHAINYDSAEITPVDVEQTAKVLYIYGGQAADGSELPARRAFLAGEGEVSSADGASVRVFELTVIDDAGESHTLRGPADAIEGFDAVERERRNRSAGVMGKIAVRRQMNLPVAQANASNLPPHPDDEFRSALPRREVIDRIKSEAPVATLPDAMIEVPGWAKAPSLGGGGDNEVRRVVVDGDKVSNPRSTIGHPSNPESNAIQAYGESLKR